MSKQFRTKNIRQLQKLYRRGMRRMDVGTCAGIIQEHDRRKEIGRLFHSGAGKI